MSTQVDPNAPLPATDEAQGSFFPSVERMDALAEELNGRRGSRKDLRSMRRRGERGRPPGATNKRQEHVAKWFLQQYGSPLAVFGEVMNMPPDVLMDMMEALQGGDAKHRPLRAIDAIRLKIEAADKAAPYIHGKMPTEVSLTTKKDVFIKIPGLKSLADAAAQLQLDENEQGLMDAIGHAAIHVLPDGSVSAGGDE